MSWKFLPGVNHQARAFIFMLGALIYYCFWLWLLATVGWLTNDTSTPLAATLLLLPLLPVGGFDIWLRLTWEPDLFEMFPSRPTTNERLMKREYGLYWFPVLICIPLWTWVLCLIGYIVYFWLAD